MVVGYHNFRKPPYVVKATLWRLSVGGFLCEKWFESALVDRWQKSFMRWYHFGGNRCIILTCFPSIGQNLIHKLTSLNLGPTVNVGKKIKHSCGMWVSKKTPTYLRNIPQPRVHEGNPFMCVFWGFPRGSFEVNLGFWHSRPSVKLITPRKINMEPENTPLEKENNLPNHFQVLC